jgi:glycosyltransferase involved in cell wall biosynthesis
MITDKISFIIPTMDRELDLHILLSSIVKQTHHPDQIIIVDGSFVEIKYIIKEFPSLNIDYVRVFPPSLAKQKNAGVKKVKDNITLVGYLDDDLELYPDSVEKMLSFWKGASKNVGGAAFAIVSGERKIGGLRKLFGLDSDSPGKVLSNGFVSMLDDPIETVSVDWLNGGATVWRREVINNYNYDEWFKGSGFMEDIDFSFNIGEKYQLVLLSEAKTEHHHHPIRGDRYYLLGKWQIVNRLYFVRKYIHRGLSVRNAWIASFSIALVNLVAGIYRADYNRVRMSFGNIIGIFISIIKKDVQITGHLKRVQPNQKNEK